jgi:hypothetical protein
MVKLRNASIVMMSSLGMFLAVGCAKERHDDIPQSARLMSENRGNIDFVAPDEGMVYVYDRSSGAMLYSGHIRNGEALRVEPRDDKITLNNRVVMDKQIRDNDDLKVFFQPDPGADVAGSRVRRERERDADRLDRSSSEIIVQPRTSSDTDRIRVKSGPDADSRVTVQPGEDGSKVTIEPK